MAFSVRGWLLTLILSLAAGWAAWLVVPGLPPPKAVQLAEEPWNLAGQPGPDLKKAGEYLATTAMWGNVEVAKVEGEQRDPAWRFLGVLSNGPEKYVLIDVEKQPNRQLKIGDQLPGGAKIEDIKQDSLCVLVNGKKRTVPIYPQARQPL